MKCLSVQQPWASLICSGIKDVENRSWRVNEVPSRILTHAGLKNVILFMFLICSLPMVKAQKVFDTHNESRADVKVFVTDKDYRADIIVYTTNTEHRAKGNKGIWFIEHNESRADKKICFVNNESRADLKVYFTNTESRADWKNPGKKALME